MNFETVDFIFLINMTLLIYLLIVVFFLIQAKNLTTVVILASVFSLLIASTYLVMGAVDVAITEAAVGAAVSTIFFLKTMKITSNYEHKPKEKKYKTGFATLIIILFATAAIASLITDIPNFGNAHSPINNEVMSYYLEQTKQNFGFPNVVTAILASFRGYDTLGETTVIMTSAICVLLLLSDKKHAKK